MRKMKAQRDSQGLGDKQSDDKDGADDASDGTESMKQALEFYTESVSYIDNASHAESVDTRDRSKKEQKSRKASKSRPTNENFERNRSYGYIYLIICVLIIVTFVLFLESMKFSTYAVQSSRTDWGSNESQDRGSDSKKSSLMRSDFMPSDLTRRIDLLRSIVGRVSDSRDFLKPKTPQYLALDWLAKFDQRNLDIPTDKMDGPETRKLVQRYALATIYYATRGELWSRKLNFMSPDDECDWNESEGQGVFMGAGLCKDGKFITTLALWNNNLQETIPPEIGLLTSLKFLSLYNNKLKGPVPTQGLKNLSTNLEVLFLHGNNIVSNFDFMCSPARLNSFRSDCLDDGVICSCCDVCCSSIDKQCIVKE